MNTSTAIAVALALIVALGLIFYGPSLFSRPENSAGVQPIQAEQATSTVSEAAPEAPAPATVTASGLSITDESIGSGTVAQAGDSVTVEYVGALPDGTVFDSTQAHGGKPFTFTLGTGQVIAGWDEGVAGMKVGGVRKLVVPPALGYGSQQYGPIPANATLTFEVKLLSVTPSAK
ncbi:MAG TPA: FKBP-type peptidyl-prolyl cis-trans isomerase [Candidatus Paceibacterota bacterium]